ncbi:MAG: rod shape-determining protein MreD [Ruminococcaceae bacterium]|nr:rod shape-determining protein MreD [Oscillospiraceae bacterium]
MNKHFNAGIIFDILLYGTLLILLSVLQTTLIPRFPIYDSVPDIMLGAVCCIGIYRKEKCAAVFGLIAGLCSDALGSVGLSLLPLFYTLVGYFSGLIGDNAREKARFAAFLITIPAVSFAKIALSFFHHIINYYETIELGQLFLYTLLPEFVYTLFLCIPSFLLVKLFDIPLNILRKRGGYR